VKLFDFSGGDAETARYLLEQDIANNPQNYFNLKVKKYT